MTSDTPAQFRPPRFTLAGSEIFARASAVLACVVLLGAIPYCPSYRSTNIPLVGMWFNTFWSDVYAQVSGLFAAHSKETLAGEATASEWNYCLLVPFIVVWLVWRLQPRLAAAPKRGDNTGYAVLAFGFFFYVAGFLMENYYVGMVSLELVYAGLIVLLFGWPVMQVLIFPWAFLMFMWPYNFMEDVALELRLLMSSLSHHVLSFIFVPNVLQGTAIISAPGSPHPFAIDIADPCSGIRSLFALVMLAAVYAFVTFERLWQQAVEIALAVPLVIAGNLVRIVILALGTIHFGEAFALGTNTQPSWFHEGAGYLVYLINFGGLIFAGSLLSRLTAENKHARP